jgi:hypothetical protein
MSTSTAIASGRIEFTPRPAMPVPQTGGRRPPSDRNNGSTRLRRDPPVRLLTTDNRVIQWSNGTTWRKD